VKSFLSSHDHALAEEYDIDRIETGRLARRISRKARSRSVGSSKPLPSREEGHRAFADAVNAGIHGRIARSADGNGVEHDADLHVSRAATSSGTSLPVTLMRKFEDSLGVDLSSVRVHTGDASASAAASVGARAYAFGQDIHFGEGEFDPGTPQGEHLIAHEVAHTVQQRGGSAGAQFKLEVTGTNDACEVEADAAADAMVAGRSFAVGGAGAAIARDRGARGRRGGHREDHSRDAAALERELDVHTDIADAQIAAARERARQLFAQAQGYLDATIGAAQTALNAVATWRRGVDAAALAELDTDYGSVALSGTGEIASILLEAAAELNPITKTIYEVVDGAITIGSLISDMAAVAHTRDLVGASGSAHTLSVSASDSILQRVVSLNHSAATQIGLVMGHIEEATSSEAGTAGGMIADEAARHREALGGGAGSSSTGSTGSTGTRGGAGGTRSGTGGRVSSDRVDGAEATATHALDRADRVNAFVEQLQQATSRLAAAPAQIANQGRQALARAQIMFANDTREAHGPVNATGTVSVNAGRVTLSVNPIGADAHTTRLSATLPDLATLESPVEVRLTLTHSVDVPQVFARPEMTELRGGELVAAVRTSGGEIQWSGVADDELGMYAAAAIGLPVRAEGGTEEEHAARGAQVRSQIANALRSVPFSELRNIEI
jgi:hypothetical protein